MSTGIQWTDETWNPGNLPLPVQYDVPFSRVQLMPERLTKPFHWKKPRRIFVNSMSDLFHEDVPDEFIDRVFAVMALTPQHTYQVLTKRPERMREYILAAHHRVVECARAMRPDGQFVGPWGPMPNVWMGVSVEDQAAADERIPHLLATPAAVRFLSCEPLLGPLIFEQKNRRYHLGYHSYANETESGQPENCSIDWVIVGGESGPHARPCNVEWIRDIVRQCKAADVPVFVKQLGSKPISHPLAYGVGESAHNEGAHWRHKLRSRHGSDPDEWPEDLRVREFPEQAT